MLDQRRASLSCRALSVLVLLMAITPAAMAVSRAEVDKLSRQCEAARTKELTPLRAEKTQECIEQKIRAPDHCQRYYTTYGNTSMTGGLRKQGMYYDLPECQAFMKAQQAFQSGR